MAERKYQMIRLGKGDYLLPSNDGSHLWRLAAYEEYDGTLTRLDGSVVTGTFWAAYRHRRPVDRLSVDDLDNWDEWDQMACMLPTRKAAIAEVMSYEP